MLEAMYRAYLDAYGEASELLRKQQTAVRFPAHGIPPPTVACP